MRPVEEQFPFSRGASRKQPVMKRTQPKTSFSRMESLPRPLALLIIASLCALPLGAQMVTGSGMEDFGKTFGISAKGWSVQQMGSSLGANEPEFGFEK